MLQCATCGSHLHTQVRRTLSGSLCAITQRHVHATTTSTAHQHLRLQAVNDGPEPPSPSACDSQKRPHPLGDCLERVAGEDGFAREVC